MPWIAPASTRLSASSTSSPALRTTYRRHSRPLASGSGTGSRATITSEGSAPSAGSAPRATREEAARRAIRRDRDLLENPADVPALKTAGIRADCSSAGRLHVGGTAAQATHALDRCKRTQVLTVVFSHAGQIPQRAETCG